MSESKVGATITRAPKDKQNPYAQIRRASLEDKRISFEARGMLAYLLAKPDTWTIHVSDLISASPDGRDKVYRILSELERFRYLEKLRRQDEQGKFAGVHYHVSEAPLPDNPDTDEPRTENPDTDNPYTGEPDTGQPHTENPEHSNKEDLPSNQFSNEEERARAGGKRPSIKSRNGASKTVRCKSPHFSKSDFVDGHIPPGQGVNPVQVYYERFDITHDTARLTAIQEDDLSQHCPDLDRLREVVIAYSRRNYKPGNLQLILDWYRDGVPRAGAHTHRSGAQNHGQNNGYANGYRTNHRGTQGDGFEQEEIRIRGKLASGTITQDEYNDRYGEICQKYGRANPLQNVR